MGFKRFSDTFTLFSRLWTPYQAITNIRIIRVSNVLWTILTLSNSQPSFKTPTPIQFKARKRESTLPPQSTVDLRFEERLGTPPPLFRSPLLIFLTKTTKATRQFYSPSVSFSLLLFVSVVFVHFLDKKNNEKNKSKNKNKKYSETSVTFVVPS